MRNEPLLKVLYRKGIAKSFPLHTMGYVLVAESILMFLCTVVSGIGDEHLVLFAIGSVGGGVVGTALLLLFRSPPSVHATTGVLTINLLWMAAIAYGCLPYLIDGFTFSHAVFESTSGFTTTGMSIVSNVSGLSAPILLWRACTGWAGGIGFIIMFCLLLRYFGLNGRNIFVSDGLNTTVSKSMGSIKNLALNFVAVYTILTGLLAMALVLLGNDVIDSICISMSTISTTGFSTLNEDLTGISMASKIFVGTFLLLSAMNFLTLFDAVTGFRFRKIAKDTEIRHMIGWFLVSSMILMMILYQSGAFVWSISDIVDTILMVISIGTTTGFVFHDFLWPSVAMLFLCILAMVGGCRESPTGGVKIARLTLVFKSMRNAISTVGFPNEVRSVKFGDTYVNNSICYSAITTVLIFVITAGLGTLAISITGVNIMDSFYLCISSLTTTGTGLYSVADVSAIQGAARWIMCILMWLGRMEITLVLVMFTSSFQKEFRASVRRMIYLASGFIRKTSNGTHPKF